MDKLQYLSGWRENEVCCYQSYTKLTNEEINQILDNEDFSFGDIGELYLLKAIIIAPDLTCFFRSFEINGFKSLARAE